MNETIKIKIKKDTHLTIFDKLLVQERTDKLFKEKDAKIKERIEKI